MDVYEAVTKRRAIRRFKDDPVPYDVLEKCVDAGRLAPNGRNRQLLEFIIVDDEQMLSRVFDNFAFWCGKPKPKGSPSPGQTPKAYIVILINRALEAEAGVPQSIVTGYDVGLSAENMILVALEQGVGSCPLRSFQGDEMKQILNVPDKYEVALVVALGYPDESPVREVAADSVELWNDSQGVRHVPKRKLEDIVHRNQFSR